MGRRRVTSLPHREFFRAMGSEETIALACTCPRSADHWYAQPRRASEAEASESDDLAADLPEG